MKNNLVEGEVNSNPDVVGVVGNSKHHFGLNKVLNEVMSTDKSVALNEVVPTDEGVTDALNLRAFNLTKLLEEHEFVEELEKHESGELKNGLMS